MHTGPTGNLRCCSYRLRDITDWPTPGSGGQYTRIGRARVRLRRHRPDSPGRGRRDRAVRARARGSSCFPGPGALAVQQVVGDVEGGHHGNPVGADDFAAGADLAHLAVQVTGGAFQVGALVVRQLMQYSLSRICTVRVFDWLMCPAPRLSDAKSSLRPCVSPFRSFRSDERALRARTFVRPQQPVLRLELFQLLEQLVELAVNNCRSASSMGSRLGIGVIGQL